MVQASETRTPWFKQMHWQIAIGIGIGLIYALIVRGVWALPAISQVEAGGGAERAVSHAIELATQRAHVIAVWERASAPFAFLGDLFIRALKMIIIPLIVASVVTGIRGMGDATELGRVGIRTIAYYMLTTLLAVLAGLLVVNLIQPGVGLGLTFEGTASLTPKPISQVFADIIPTNVLDVFSNNKMLPSIFVSVLIGLGLLVIGKEGEPLAKFFESMNALVLKITDWIMACAPVGVGALFVKTLLDPELADLGAFFQDLGAYMLAVVVGLGVHAVITLPALLFLFTRRSPIAFAQQMSASLITAFSTASSSATYPVTLECVTENAGVPKKSANFVLPLGATINMDGTALYEAVAAIFIANALGFDLGLGQQVIIVFTATLAAIGAAGVPSAGLVTMIIVLESVGLPAGAYALVVAVDRILDMCRTTVNVWGDAVGAAIVAEWIDAPPAEESLASDSEE